MLAKLSQRVQCILELMLKSDREPIKWREVSRPFLKMSVEKEGRNQDWSTWQDEGGGTGYTCRQEGWPRMAWT